MEHGQLSRHSTRPATPQERCCNAAAACGQAGAQLKCLLGAPHGRRQQQRVSAACRRGGPAASPRQQPARRSTPGGTPLGPRAGAGCRAAVSPLHSGRRGRARATA
jgi:hypothetical protein